jgi:hypothetical protein
MEDLEKKIEEQASEKVEKVPSVMTLLDKKVEQTTDVKTAIDILATKTALEQEETLEKVVVEKEEELRNDAEAKRIQAEKERIEKETEKIKQEKEKELAELDKEISKKKAEVEQLKVDGDKAQAFFESNKDILKYIGVREKKSMKTMQGLMYPASIVFVIVQILIFPLTLCGLLLETIVNIVGGVCGTIKNNAIKIILSILVILLIVAVGFFAYYYGGKYLFA